MNKDPNHHITNNTSIDKPNQEGSKHKGTVVNLLTGTLKEEEFEEDSTNTTRN